MEKAKNTGSKLVIQRVLNADSETVFKALTAENQLRNWFYPRPEGWSAEVSFNAQAGEAYSLTMIDPDGKKYVHEGEIKEIVPNEKLVFTWNSHAVDNTLVTITLQKVSKGTEITLTHDFLPADEKDGHEEGWTELIERLRDFINQNIEVK